jgi:hypothetical protein
MRDLVRDIDGLSEYGQIDETLVRRIYKLDGLEALVDFVRALLSETGLEIQLAALDRWDVSPEVKREHLQGFLLYVLMNEVLAVRRPSRIYEAISRDDIQAVVNALTERAAAAAVPAERYLEGLIQIWNPDPVAFTATTLELRVIHANRLVSTPVEPPETKEGIVRRRTRRHRSLGNQASETPGRYLTRAQAEALIDAASFLVQVHGKFLNTRITVRHVLLGHSSQKEGAAFISALVRAMRKAFRRWSLRESDLHWACVHEVCREGDHQTHFVAHFPMHLQRCQRRSKFRPKGGAIAGHLACGA